MKKNSNIEIQEAMKTLNNWILYEDKIKKQFQFKDFSEAMRVRRWLATMTVSACVMMSRHVHGTLRILRAAAARTT